MNRIAITGGTGFVGTQIQKTLADRALRLVVRDPSSVPGDTAHEIVPGDVLDPPSLARAFAGVETVIHLVAIIEESKDQTFDHVIRQGTENVVAAAQSAGVERLLHMSAMGAQDNPAYPYLTAKWKSEQAVIHSELKWTIFRPSVIFGPGDGFINVLANLIRKAPLVPVVGSGKNAFQPVARQDVADAFKRAVDDPGTIGKVFEIGGGEIYSYEQMLDLIATELGKTKPKVHIPVTLMNMVVRASAPLPKSMRPPVTSEQLKMLSLDNCTDHSDTAMLIGREPLALRNGLSYIRGVPQT